MPGQIEQLTRLFERAPRPSWVRFAQAYLMMAKANYRPAAPGDGMGSVNLSDEDMEDRDLLLKEAVFYATRFGAEDDATIFRIGCSNYSTNRAFVFLIEASRLLAGGGPSDLAISLLKLAIKDIQDADVRRKARDGEISQA